MYLIWYAPNVKTSISEEYFKGRRSEAGYADAYKTAARRISMFDDLVHAMDERRLGLKLSKADLARRADLPPTAVRRLFSQQHKNPTLATLVAIADALQTSLSLIPEEVSVELGAQSQAAPTPAGRDHESGTQRRTA
ncbi:hypothetical protein BH23ACT12_BH23ACT12_20180 [soil metagenome]